MEVMFSYIKAQNGALILATHDQDIALLCDRIYHLYDKSLHAVK